MRARISSTIEALAYASGLALGALYFGTQAWSAYASNRAVDALYDARVSTSEAMAGGPELANGARELQSKTPDTSTWSPKRLAQYLEARRLEQSPEAVLRIPRLDLEVPIFHGTSASNLNRGAGLIEGTADVTSATGNIGIAAHRDGFFRPLKDIAVGDVLLLETVHETKTYRVAALRVVDPNEVSVLDPTPIHSITLVTCYPFYYLGSAPQRFIVLAHVSKTENVDERPLVN